MFYCFAQNNSGGSWRFDSFSGISHYVIIEADSAIEANSRAELIGIYFDGVNNGVDCSCCGSRWHEVDRTEGKKEPEIYGVSVRTMCYTHTNKKWMVKGEPEAFIHFAEGPFFGFIV